MFELAPEIREFIEQNIELIQNNNWDVVYDNAMYKLGQDLTGLFTLTMLHCNIDPVVQGQLDYIPDEYLCGVRLEENLIVSKNVKELCYCCFSYSTIPYIELPESLEKIHEYVFFSSDIKRIKIPPKCVDIHITAFEQLYDCVVVCKKGSFADRYAHQEKMEVEYY